MFRWIKATFITEKFKVRINKTLSERITAENGVPQGSVISPILFLIIINDIYASDDPLLANLCLQMMGHYGHKEGT